MCGFQALAAVTTTPLENLLVRPVRARLLRRQNRNAESQGSALAGRGVIMTIEVSEDIQVQLDQVKEWLESKVGREVTYDEVLSQVLKNFQSVLYPEDLGSA
jgi:hypothetical protein